MAGWPQNHTTDFVRLAVTALVILGVADSRGVAQAVHPAPDSWAIVAVGVPESAGASHSAAAIADRQFAAHPSIIPARLAQERFEVRASSPPIRITEREYEDFATCSDDALLQLARGHRERARTALSECLQQAEAVLSALNREAEAAREVLDACMFMTRAFLEDGHEQLAREQAVRCIGLAPDVTPSPMRHPPETREVYDWAVDHLATLQHGGLEITSTPSGCAAYINGRRLGSTPLQLTQLPPRPYLVQVECDGELGRVHRVDIGGSAASAHIDHRFDQVVRSDGGLSLIYPNEAARTNHWRDDAARIADAIDATTLLVVRYDGISPVSIERYDVERDLLTARVLLAIDPTANDFRYDAASAALQALMNRHSRDFSVRPSRALPAPENSQRRRSRHDGASNRWRSGWALVGAGIALSIASWPLWAATERRSDAYARTDATDPNFIPAQEQFLRLRPWPLVTSAAAGLLTTLSLPLLVPYGDERIPGWTYAVAGAGAALLGVGIWMHAREHCELSHPRGACIEGVDDNGLPWILYAHAVPLLTVPLTYALHRATDNASLRASIEVQPTGLGFSLGGSYW